MLVTCPKTSKLSMFCTSWHWFKIKTPIKKTLCHKSLVANADNIMIDRARTDFIRRFWSRLTRLFHNAIISCLWTREDDIMKKLLLHSEKVYFLMSFFIFPIIVHLRYDITLGTKGVLLLCDPCDQSHVARRESTTETMIWFEKLYFVQQNLWIAAAFRDIKHRYIFSSMTSIKS